MNVLLTNLTNSLLLNIGVALVFALIISGVYYYIHKDTLNDEMVLTLLLLPVVVCAIIYAIGENVAGAFSLAGIFTIVRFRSTQASPKDITYILIGVAGGLTSAMGFYAEGATLILLSVIIIILFEKMSTKKTRQTLKILIPEDLVNDEAIDKVLSKYAQNFALEEMNTKDLGSLFELVYRVNLFTNIKYKNMIDELRIINGNLTIKLSKTNK